MEENIVDSLGKKIGQLRLALEMHDTARGGDGSGVVRTRETQTMERIIPNLLHIVPNMIWDLIGAWMTGDSYFAYKKDLSAHVYGRRHELYTQARWQTHHSKSIGLANLRGRAYSVSRGFAALHISRSPRRR